MTPEQEHKLSVAFEKLSNMIKLLENIQAQVVLIQLDVELIQQQTSASFQTTTSQQTAETTKQEIVEFYTPPLEEQKINTFTAETTKQEVYQEQVHTEAIEQETYQEQIHAKTIPVEKELVEQITKPKKSLEELIGGNILSKIGIVLLLLGIGIFIKYAVDNDLISPLGRVLLAYTAAGALIGVAHWLFKKYKEYSALLMAGGLATLYFTTFLGFLLYNIPPGQVFTFILMVIITGYTIFEAVRYKKEVIGVFGLVAAYAIPFLLSDGSGGGLVLFIYMTIVNIAILTIAFTQRWSVTGVVAFSMTWIIFIAWLALLALSILSNDTYLSILMGFIFSIIFFITFFTIFMLNQWYERSRYDEIKILLNTLIFYPIGVFLLISLEGKVGMFTPSFFQNPPLSVALFTTAIFLLYGGSVIFAQSKGKVFANSIDILQTLAIFFLTTAIPLFFGEELSLIAWAMEAVGLLAYGKVKNIKLYRYASFIVLVLDIYTLFSLWGSTYFRYDTNFTLIFNSAFLATATIVGTFMSNLFVNHRYKIEDTKNENELYLLGIVGMCYIGINLEIYAYSSKISYETAKIIDNVKFFDISVKYFGTLTWLIFTAVYSAILILVERHFYQNILFKQMGLFFVYATKFLFIFVGITTFIALRERYIWYNPAAEHSFTPSNWYFAIRFLVYLAVAFALFAQIFSISSEKLILNKQPKQYILLINFIFLAVLSHELSNFIIMLLNYGDANTITQSYNIALRSLTVLWGIYALAMIGYGIWKKRKILRLAGIFLIVITLFKLFTFDLNYVSTLQRIIVFISIALILLVISFLYQKYKDIILAEDQD